ncbi:MAG: fibronectin type III domain-containing protein [Candidatus Eisenbacteria bacterium]|uniref:Fibronectin type III domain-containing protein n=1 Tax=Eiseniibacteriota bacterium TaxID=2212470 RepID=A0A956NJ78_UNCEI|nr:fibronectin type III domain-containing protein [Candidatus Eisenbacteria bacterium]MCB9463797.1 fibronectin type III domain-containing protein [Candidatus Eisenbacteria bacterium]
MKAWTAAWGLILVIFLAACGISDGGPGGDIPKTDDELAIDNLTVASLSDTSATLTWDTTAQAVSTLFYGKEATALAYTKGSPVGTEHVVRLENLTEDTDYHYQVHAADGFGNTATTQEAVFHTLPAADLNDPTPPVISNVQANGITAHSATITWDTDDKTIGEVRYGTSPLGLTQSKATGATHARSHVVVLSGLLQNTQYYFQVYAQNRALGDALSATVDFTTESDPTLYVFPETISITAGTTQTFEIRIEDAKNVAGLGFMLNVNPPSALEILTISGGEFCSPNNGGYIFLPRYPTLSPIAADASWVIRFQNGAPVGSYAGSDGTVARITCKGRALTEGGTISFRKIPLDAGEGYEFDEYDPENETRLLDHNRQVMPVNVRNATLIVN